LGLKFDFGLKSSNQSNFCLPLSEIKYHKVEQRKKTNQTGVKFFKPKQNLHKKQRQIGDLRYSGKG